MEFPYLGQNCGNADCRQLDFLPLKCNECSTVFCKFHIKHEAHGCAEAYKRERCVPSCPLCNAPITILPGESADAKVDAHIESACRSSAANELKGQIFRNRCSHTGCRHRELVEMLCRSCGKNFCLRHRNELDHACALAKQTTGASPFKKMSEAKAKATIPESALRRFESGVGVGASAAAVGSARQESNSGRVKGSNEATRLGQTRAASASASASASANANANAGSVQGIMPSGMTEDEALARALQESENEEARRRNGGQAPTQSQTRGRSGNTQTTSSSSDGCTTM